MARVLVTGRSEFPHAALVWARPEDDADRATIERSRRLGARFHGVVALRVQEGKVAKLEALMKSEGWTFYRPQPYQRPARSKALTSPEAR